jgi:RHS repeat-associated protein
MKLGDGVGREPAPDVATYTYAGMGYANPHAVTQLSSGYSTSTFVYDSDGNLAQKTTDGTTTTYIWDYANRLIALGSGGATTTYGYDVFGTRVYQIVATTSTTTYPFKFFSVASTTKSSTNYATSTEYVFNGDTLLATVDQGFKNGSATGTAQTRYIHPDHLGSTNVVTDASGTVCRPWITTPMVPRASRRAPAGLTGARKYIGQFADASGLNYLNARYYNNSQGQFLSEDPVSLGDPKQQTLQDPQSLNTYSYSGDNPITKKDPSGKYWDISAQVTFSPQPEFPGFSAAVGVRFDSHGPVGYVSAGPGWGYGGKPITVSNTPGDIPRDQNGNTVVGTDVGLVGWSSNIQRDGSIGAPSINYTLGLGADVYARKEFSVSLLGGKPPPGMILTNTSNFSTPNYTSPSFLTYFNQSIQSQTSIQSRTSTVSGFNAATGASAPQTSSERSSARRGMLRNSQEPDSTAPLGMFRGIVPTPRTSRERLWAKTRQRSALRKARPSRSRLISAVHGVRPVGCQRSTKKQAV